VQRAGGVLVDDEARPATAHGDQRLALWPKVIVPFQIERGIAYPGSLMAAAGS
jgi:hypothetical protein